MGSVPYYIPPVGSQVHATNTTDGVTLTMDGEVMFVSPEANAGNGFGVVRIKDVTDDVEKDVYRNSWDFFPLT